jgi:hypothetical protein
MLLQITRWSGGIQGSSYFTTVKYGKRGLLYRMVIRINEAMQVD